MFTICLSDGTKRSVGLHAVFVGMHAVFVGMHAVFVGMHAVFVGLLVLFGFLVVGSTVVGLVRSLNIYFLVIVPKGRGW